MKLLYVLLLLNLPFFAFAQNVEWITPMEHDFGDIVKNKPVEFKFQYKNTSGEPMTIDNVRTTCGCTALDWSDEPLAPDSIGVISVNYDAKKSGYFRKKVKVYLSSIHKAQILWLEGWVEAIER